MIEIEQETQMDAAGCSGKGKYHRSRLLLLLAFCTLFCTTVLEMTSGSAPGLVFAADYDGIPEDAVLIPDLTDRWAQDVTYAVAEREDGALQIVDSNGIFVYDMLVVLVGGKLCYADENGLVAASRMIEYNGKNYYAKADGSIAINDIGRAHV